jgi:hypothetical protein
VRSAAAAAVNSLRRRCRHFCDEHVPEHTLKPLSCLLALMAFGLVVLVGWLAYRWLGV